MKITYIHHSSFLLETDTAYLLFDYFEGELPPIGKDKPLFVFASHRHADHFSAVVFTLFADHPKVSYLLSSDISAKKVPESVLGKTHFLNMHEVYTIGDLTIETLRSTDEGVAFLVKLEGKHIYHAGDLNHWFWKGEDKGWNNQMALAYRSEIARLPSALDIAFVPVDPRLEESFDLGAKELLENRRIGYLFPMHFWNDFSVCRKLQTSIDALSCTVMQVEHTGQSWRLV
ncbi:putative Zn-dependent hydrolase of beta-lactamase fold protein [Sphaerochaeta pleomorpha str. Grapes]|uniref:Putative Zn-dependent hydrolase of beta-lactamase fold protein n=1 Tax=Sphaerochaeta pleomorpha (strain ATCC BAA-1885 / DSM 22778 / Grapes) TaxID=158190 RepID=G8QV50_SPHPG|nr:MBL fold metallo-hydrolase [Sphaerochaeta pleomorpha]AEV29286.1 putative Zn-dependent hydrolase of beta-lactamase fold protein [Sphaerochaeta pleomorpha str. Grapes]